MKPFAVILLLILVSCPAYGQQDSNSGKVKSLPPGLQKKYQRTGELPPGWQKKIIKGEVLDPVLFAVAKDHPIHPGDYRLKDIQGTELLRLEDRIIRIMQDTKVVLEVFGLDLN